MTFCWLNLLDAYNFNIETVAYIHAYLKNRKQCVIINGTQSYVSIVTHRSVLGPILYNLFLMTSFNSFY